MMRFRRYSIELYRELGVFETVGSLRFASSKESFKELQRGVSRARGIGLDGAGYVYMVGGTSSPNLTTVSAVQSNFGGLTANPAFERPSASADHDHDEHQCAQRDDQVSDA